MDGAERGVQTIGMPRRQPILENLKTRREHLQSDLQEVDALIAALEGQPQMVDILDRMRRIGI